MKRERKKHQPKSVAVDFITPLSPEDCRARLEATTALSRRLFDDFVKHISFLSDEKFVLEYEMTVGRPALFRLRGALERIESGTRIHGEWRGPIVARNAFWHWSRIPTNFRNPVVRRHLLITLMAPVVLVPLVLGIGWGFGRRQDVNFHLMLVFMFFLLTWRTASSIVRLLFGSEKIYDQHSTQELAERFRFLMLFQTDDMLGMNADAKHEEGMLLEAMGKPYTAQGQER